MTCVYLLCVDHATCSMSALLVQRSGRCLQSVAPEFLYAFQHLTSEQGGVRKEKTGSSLPT